MSFESLIKQSEKAARSSGGLLFLLLAVQDRKTKNLRWDKKDARWILGGTVISYALIQNELSKLENKLAGVVQRYNENLWSGRWTSEKWSEEMEKLLIDYHLIFAALALGGLALAVRNKTVKRRITRDVKALRGFRTALDGGILPATTTPVVTPSMVRLADVKDRRKTQRVRPRGLVASLAVANSRARSYIRSLSVTFHLLNHRAHILAGYTQARRVLSIAEHCRTKGPKEGCLEAERRGWMDIYRMPPIGTLVCVQFCKCHIIYRR